MIQMSIHFVNYLKNNLKHRPIIGKLLDQSDNRVPQPNLPVPKSGIDNKVLYNFAMFFPEIKSKFH